MFLMTTMIVCQFTSLLIFLGCSLHAASGSLFNPVDNVFGTTEETAPQKVVGGTPVPVGTYPWFTMLLYMTGNVENRQTCGGMLVSPEWVLTAAHCIDSDIINDGAVRIGAFAKPYKSGDNGGQKVEFFRTTTVVSHPSYNSGTENNDFALLKLDGTSTITPVPMDSTGLSDTYSTGKIVIPFSIVQNSV